MKNRDLILLLIVLAVGLFIWQLLQKVNTSLATISQTDKAGADSLSAAVNKISTSTADLSAKVAAIPAPPEPVVPFDYASSYNAYKQITPQTNGTNTGTD